MLRFVMYVWKPSHLTKDIKRPFVNASVSSFKSYCWNKQIQPPAKFCFHYFFSLYLVDGTHTCFPDKIFGIPERRCIGVFYLEGSGGSGEHSGWGMASRNNLTKVNALPIKSSPTLTSSKYGCDIYLNIIICKNEASHWYNCNLIFGDNLFYLDK